jgi:hypothetical protein
MRTNTFSNFALAIVIVFLIVGCSRDSEVRDETDKPNMQEPALETSDTAPSELQNFRQGEFAGFSFGQSLDEFRQHAEANGIQIKREIPYSTNGTLIDLGNFNLRFTEDGTFYQCYILNGDAKFPGGLTLRWSEVSDFENYFKSVAKRGVDAGGRVTYNIRENGILFALYIADDSHDVLSVMITKQ